MCMFMTTTVGVRSATFSNPSSAGGARRTLSWFGRLGERARQGGPACWSTQNVRTGIVVTVATVRRLGASRWPPGKQPRRASIVLRSVGGLPAPGVTCSTCRWRLGYGGVQRAAVGRCASIIGRAGALVLGSARDVLHGCLSGPGPARITLTGPRLLVQLL